MATMQDRREAYRKQKAEFAAAQEAGIEYIKTGVMQRLCERFPGSEFAWADPQESPYALRVYVRHEGKEYGAELPFTQLAIEGEREYAIHWFCEALSRYLAPRPSKSDYRQEANALFDFIADELERRFRSVQVMRRRDDPRDRLRVMVASGNDYIHGAFDALQLENWQETGKAFVDETTAKLKEVAHVT